MESGQGTADRRKANIPVRTVGQQYHKIAVELCMVLHVTAATNQIDEDTLARLRGMCVDEVKRLRGSVRLENAVKFQNGE